MELVPLIIAAALTLIIVGFEGWRRWAGQPLGLLSAANLIFVLNFCIPPLFIFLVQGTSLEVSPYGAARFDMRLYLFPLIEKLGLSRDAYVSAMGFAVYAYAILLLGYGVVMRYARHVVRPLQSNDISPRTMTFVGLVLGGVAIAALFLFSRQFHEFAHFLQHDVNLPLYQSDPTGVWLMMKLGAYVRGDIISVSRGYLQILILLGIPAVMFLSASALKEQGIVRWLLVGGAILVWSVVFVRVFYAAGRLEFVSYVALFPVAAMFMMRSRVAVVGAALPLMAFVFFMAVLGKGFFQLSELRLTELFDVLFTKAGLSILFILNEFAFPYVISANTIHIVPEVVNYRYFIDLPLAALYMLPSMGGVDSWPQMISHIHLEMLPTMPIDLLSFGYYSLGALGVVIMFAALGVILALLDLWLIPGTGWLAQCLRAGWMMYLPLRIMYADPYTAMKSGFGLIVGTMLVMAMAWQAKRWRT